MMRNGAKIESSLFVKMTKLEHSGLIHAPHQGGPRLKLRSPLRRIHHFDEPGVFILIRLFYAFG
jgi:hypothetical protein